MPKTPATATAVGEGLKIVHINPTLLALKPRPVSLLFTNSTMSPKTAAVVLNPDQKAVLLNSLALFLQRSGYSKTLKKLRSEAKLQDQNDDISEGSAFDLEEIFSKFLESSAQGCKKPETLTKKDEDLQPGRSSDKGGTFVFSAPSETANVRKKKKSAKNDADTTDRASGASAEFVDSEIVDKLKKKRTTDLESNTKPMEKSAKKLSPHPVTGKCEPVSEGKQEVDSNLDSVIDSVEKSTKSKAKKQKKDSLTPQKLSSANTEKIALMVDEKQDNESKKRKRLSFEEDSTPPDDGKQMEEKKRQKTEAAEPEPDLQANGNVDKKEHKAKTQKSAKKLQNGSSEPTTAQRFQRVKAEEVVFSDERLKDNSYWAKDGAETGYGAKAQEVLGQVKGRGFRHEKTKKKRGSYRGGQIDVHSHSIKFNYSDED